MLLRFSISIFSSTIGRSNRSDENKKLNAFSFFISARSRSKRGAKFCRKQKCIFIFDDFFLPFGFLARERYMSKKKTRFCFSFEPKLLFKVLLVWILKQRPITIELFRCPLKHSKIFFFDSVTNCCVDIGESYIVDSRLFLV